MAQKTIPEKLQILTIFVFDFWYFMNWRNQNSLGLKSCTDKVDEIYRFFNNCLMLKIHMYKQGKTCKFHQLFMSIFLDPNCFDTPKLNASKAHLITLTHTLEVPSKFLPSILFAHILCFIILARLANQMLT